MMAAEEPVEGIVEQVIAGVLAGLAVGETRPLLTVDQAAERLGMGRRTIYEEMKAGRLAWVEIGDRRKVEAAEIDRYIAQRRVDPREVASG